MKILVIGGTGFVGPLIVRRLHELGHQVTVFHRGRTEADLPAEVRHLHAAPEGTRSRAHLRECAAEFTRLAPDVVLDMVPITEDDARTVVDLFRGLAGRVVAISSQDVYRTYGALSGIEAGSVQPVPITEDGALRERLFPYRSDPPRAADDPQRYLDDYDKILAERVYLSDSALTGTILRLPMVYGPRDPQHRLREYLRCMDDQRPAIILEEGLARWRWTRAYSENVALAVTLAVTDARAAGRVYNVGEESTLTMQEWVRAIGEVAGWKGEIVTVSNERLPEKFRHGMHVEHHLVTDSTRIRRELGFREVVSHTDGLARTIEWERRNSAPTAGSRDYSDEDALLESLRRERES